jgi:hypothetical protein
MKQLISIKVHTLVDLIHPVESRYNKNNLRAKNFVRLDIERNKLPFRDKEFDVCVCSHTLEDLHNPFLAINEMSRVAKRGIVITPSRGKDSEFSSINFSNWKTGGRRVPGLAHHLWFFELIDGKLVVVPKNYPLLYSQGMQIVRWLGEEECVYVWKGKIDYRFDQKLNLEFRDLITNYKAFMNRRRRDILQGLALIYIDNPIKYVFEYVKDRLKN